MIKIPELLAPAGSLEMQRSGFSPVFEGQLLRGPWLMGEAFTIADISVAYALALGLFLGLGDRMPETVKDYHRRATDRSAYHRASAVA